MCYEMKLFVFFDVVWNYNFIFIFSILIFMWYEILLHIEFIKLYAENGFSKKKNSSKWQKKLSKPS
jgi:Ni/Fe-hydrogenase subunit HybB-like protein